MYGNNYAPVNNIIMVNGVDEARNLNLIANSRIIAMDENEPYFYMVTVDAVGLRKVTAYKYEEIRLQQLADGEYVSKADFDALQARLEELMNKIGGSKNGKSDCK